MSVVIVNGRDPKDLLSERELGGRYCMHSIRCTIGRFSVSYFPGFGQPRMFKVEKVV